MLLAEKGLRYLVILHASQSRNYFECTVMLDSLCNYLKCVLGVLLGQPFPLLEVTNRIFTMSNHAEMAAGSYICTGNLLAGCSFAIETRNCVVLKDYQNLLH